MPPLSVRFLRSLAELPEPAWSRLLRPDDNAFVSWQFLRALETSGCASPEAGWLPLHLGLYRGSELIAAAPGYIKQDTDGDFSRDWDLASVAERARLPYYPKLVLTVPFTPVTGRRLLVAEGEDVAACTTAICEAARSFVEKEQLGSLHVLFATEAEATRLSEQGFTTRVGIQYHFQNPGYRSEAEFYGRFSSKRRHALRREQAAAAQQGIGIRTVRGREIAEDPTRWADLAHALHSSTVDKLVWGRRWLNQAFYRALFTWLPEPMELVIAEREGRVIAGAFNVALERTGVPPRLFGRYWGCFEEHPFLHFNVCYYHTIAECIARGITVFEGGAGGEHKIARGFEPSPTYTAHWFRHPGLAAGLRRALLTEAAARKEALARWQADAPVLKPLPPR